MKNLFVACFFPHTEGGRKGLEDSMVGKVARLIPMEDVRVIQLPTTMLGWQLHLHLYPCETPHWLAWTPCEWDFFVTY